MRRIIYSSFIVALLGTPLNAWWSVEARPTHYGISENAVDYLRTTYPNQYPDIERFKKTIVDATYTSYNDKVAHGFEEGVFTTSEAGRYAGGNYNLLWKEHALRLYKNSQFDGNNNAYFRIGSMAHLVQDQLVPAHAANIYHGYYLNSGYNFEADPDDMEAWVGQELLAPSISTDVYSQKDPSFYYYNPDNTDLSPIVNTQDEIKEWRYPFDGAVTEWRGRLYCLV